MNCRMCGSKKLDKYLDLGHQPPSDAFLTEEQLNKPIVTYPLNVYLCKECGLSQLGYVVSPNVLYQQDYPYESSTTETGRKHYWDFAKHVVEKLGLKVGDTAVDIGSNVGVLLEGFANCGLKILGVDPALNIVQKANARGIPTLHSFFNKETANEMSMLLGAYDQKRPSVITGTNVFAHVDDLNSFMEGIKALLKWELYKQDNNGVFIFESPSLMELIKNNAYSSIYHEHLSYLSLKPVVEFVKKFGMRVFDVEKHNIHEGSFRVYIDRTVREVSKNVDDYLEEEKSVGVSDFRKLTDFAAKAYKHLFELNALVAKLKQDGKSICLLSAPAKGMTIVSSLGWNDRVIDFATEKSELKIGKFTPSGGIPIYKDYALLDMAPDCSIILAWNFEREIIENNKEYLKIGGKFISIFPEVKIIE